MEQGDRVILTLISLTFFFLSVLSSRSCTERQFRCHDGSECIPIRWQCDNGPDCTDGSDELNCKYKPCEQDEFRCPTSQKCISKSDKCDGFNDCSDGWDEKNCSLCDAKKEYQCGRGIPNCISKSKLCDGHFDCQDLSDEKSDICFVNKTVSKTCQKEMFSCKGGGCISSSLKCDGKKDCKDGSDEEGCKPTNACPVGEFKCHSGSPKCIDMIKKCDTFKDCEDNSDEQGCQPLMGSNVCPMENDFFCGIPGKCISHLWKCDGEPDCPNAADERNCAATTCPPPKIACNSGNKCLHPYQKCDGVKDCPDGSDEASCPKLSKRNTCKDKFPCGSIRQNGCVDWNKVCDGKSDCRDGEDERPGGDPNACRRDLCKENYGGCTHICENRFTYKVCKCPKGLQLESDKETCVDVNECEIWGSCSQKCENMKGGKNVQGFKCSCDIGYSPDKINKTRCVANGEAKSLLLATQEYIRQYSLNNNYEERVIVSDLINVIGLEYDIHSKPPKVFWTQPTPPTLYMSNFGDKPSENIEIYYQRKSIPGGLAFDWIHNLLYFCDTGLQRIAVMNPSNPKMGVSVIAEGDIEEPRAIAVDPKEGWLYWTDWGTNAKISKIGMNGHNREILVDTKIILPNALALDLPRRRLYWCDAKLHTISTVDLNGNDRRLIYKNHDIYPFSMSVFEDEIYWSDWHYESVMSVNKFHATAHKTLFDKHHISAIRVFHVLMQPTNIPNRCRENRCSHFCLPAPRIGDIKHDPLYTCACPVNYTLMDDDRRCTQVTIPTKRTTMKTTTTPKTTVKLSGTTSTPLSTTYSNVVSSSTATPKGKSNFITLTPPMEGKNVTSTNSTIILKERRVGHVAGITIGITLLVFGVIGVVMLVLYRIYSRKNIRSMNFDNPVYRKANAECDGDGDAEAQYPMNASNGTRTLQARAPIRAPIWTGGVANDAVEA